MQEESEMTETNTSGIITAAADIIAGAFNALPKRVCNQHKFSDYADYLRENLPAQAELDLQREKPLNPAPLVSVAIACSGASRAAVLSTLEALGKQTYANFEVCLVSELAQAGLTDYEGIPKFRLVLFNGTAYEQLKAAEKMLCSCCPEICPHRTRFTCLFCKLMQIPKRRLFLPMRTP